MATPKKTNTHAVTHSGHSTLLKGTPAPTETPTAIPTATAAATAQQYPLQHTQQHPHAPQLQVPQATRTGGKASRSSNVNVHILNVRHLHMMCTTSTCIYSSLPHHLFAVPRLSASACWQQPVLSCLKEGLLLECPLFLVLWQCLLCPAVFLGTWLYWVQVVQGHADCHGPQLPPQPLLLLLLLLLLSRLPAAVGYLMRHDFVNKRNNASQ